MSPIGKTPEKLKPGPRGRPIKGFLGEYGGPGPEIRDTSGQGFEPDEATSYY